MEPSNILILGGCGFIGRNLVSHLVENNLVKHLRVVDKVPPQIAWLGPPHDKHFQHPNVEFKSANLINPGSCKNAFAPPNGVTWDYVINCAGETKHAQTDPIYKEGILTLSLNCAREAAQHRVKRFVEISAAQFASSEKHAHKEDDKAEPWTYIAKWKRQVEIELRSIPDLNYTILRPALVYGPGDKNGLMTRLIIASIYKQLDETMKLLWSDSLKMNTVHVSDLCRAITFACGHGKTVANVYNVVDEANSTQGSLTSIISDLYRLNIEYYGALVSSVVDLAGAADEGNDKHMSAWAEACARDDVQNTPLSPHMDFEMLLNRHVNLNGEKLRQLGFQYDVPRPTIDNIRQTIDYFLSMKVFPYSLAP